MGRIADHVVTMRGCSLAQIVQTIAEMEAEQADDQKSIDKWQTDFEAFWVEWPNKVGKPAARKAYAAARKRGNSRAAIFEGLERYIFTKPADRPWLNPATFLNQDRFNDQPATVSTTKPSKTSELRNDLRQRIAERTGREGGDDLGPVRRLDERPAISGQSPRLLGRG